MTGRSRPKRAHASSVAQVRRRTNRNVPSRADASPAHAAPRERSTWWGSLLAKALVSGAAVGTLTTAALALLSRFRGREPLEPVGWTSHWYRGEDMNRRHAEDPGHVLLGLATHYGASVLWGAVFQGMRRIRPERSPAVDAVGVAAVAALVDYGVVPKRLTPGWEKALDAGAITAVYAAMAVALLATAPRETQGRN